MSIFKQYDIRGIYPSELDEETAILIGKTCANYFKKGTFVVAYDARLSSKKLFNNFIRSFEEEAKNKKRRFTLKKVGFSSTPMFYFLVNHFRAVGGAMITASHNPSEYNGFKIVGKGAKMIGGKDMEKLISDYK